MSKLVESFKSLLNKDVTSFLNKHKIIFTSVIVLVLLACVGLFVTYALYQSVDVTPIVGATVGEIPELDVRIMVEAKDAQGKGTNSYELYSYIPKAGYEYNSKLSKCSRGSKINYDKEKFEAKIDSNGHDTCYLYFDSTADVDFNLKIYTQDKNDLGQGIKDAYTLIENESLPKAGYVFNKSKSYCDKSSSIDYDSVENMFTIEASEKDTCYAYMDAVEADVVLTIYTQNSKNSEEYTEVNTIPSNAFYDLNSEKSGCSGSSTITFDNQRILLTPMSKTKCVAYLDIASGPIIESIKAEKINNNVKLSVTASNLGTIPRKYYFSIDGGKNYVNSESNNYTFENVTATEFKVYVVDANEKKSSIITTSKDYIYNGLFDYSNQVQTMEVTVPGYYFLEAWGAQNSDQNLGGYSSGYVKLNAGDNLYIYIGSAGKGASTATNVGEETDIRINSDTYNNRVLIAGGGTRSGYVFTRETASSYPGEKEISDDYFMEKASSFAANYKKGFSSVYDGTETGHKGNGYVKVTYVGTTLD